MAERRSIYTRHVFILLPWFPGLNLPAGWHLPVRDPDLPHADLRMVHCWPSSQRFLCHRNLRDHFHLSIGAGRWPPVENGEKYILYFDKLEIVADCRDGCGVFLGGRMADTGGPRIYEQVEAG